MSQLFKGSVPVSLSNQLHKNKEPYGVAISWDKVKKDIDIDLQAVLVNGSGKIVNAIYFNNMSCYDGAVVHGGDERSGVADGFDEVIWIKPSQLVNVEIVIFVVAAYSGGTLADIGNGLLHFVDKDGTLEKLPVETYNAGVDAMVMLKKKSNGEWKFVTIDQPSEPGNHFMDILEPTIGDIIRDTLPNAPANQSVSFAIRLQKGGLCSMPQKDQADVISVGLGWDIREGHRAIDLDISAVFFGADGKDYGAVYYDKLSMFGVKHSGNNTTGYGDGDDEKIQIKFTDLPNKVKQVFIIVNCKTFGCNLSSVLTGYCRVVGGACSAGSEIARYDFIFGRKEPGLIMGRFLRQAGNRWGFQLLREYCRGRTWMESLKYMDKLQGLAADDFNTVYQGSASISKKKSSHKLQ